MSTVYRKTAKGAAEIESRAHRLPPRLRGALIMVDGQRSVDDLVKLLPGDPQAALTQLTIDGFIEVFAVLADRPPQPVQAVVDAAVSNLVSLDTTKRDAVRFLNDKLGPAAEGIAMKIERAKTMPELRPLLVSAAQLLRSICGATVSDGFAARFLADEA